MRANTDRKSLRPMGCLVSATRKFSGTRGTRFVLGEDGYTGWPYLLSITLIPPPWGEKVKSFTCSFFFAILGDQYVCRADSCRSINTVRHLCGYGPISNQTAWKKERIRVNDVSLGNELHFLLTFRMDCMRSELSPGPAIWLSLVEYRSMACSD